VGQSSGLLFGDLYWLDACPPLEGHLAKRRLMIVVNPGDHSTGEVIVLVVATSTTALASETDRIALPNREDEPQTKTGLPKRCWVVPRWYVRVRQEVLQDYIGYVPAKLQQRIIAAVLERLKPTN
jgi:mRNA-degrading endonuclease toxin of MazEF toxin-antitoxin module